jgi:uncharacterized tellurite resistance protein B-like protein
MGLFERFKNSIDSSELKGKKSHLKNLYSIAIADGKLENEEFDFILEVSNRIYLKPSDVQSIILSPEDIAFFIPEHNREKIDQIYDCVTLCLVDGEISEKEISTCKLIAAKFGFKPIIVDKILGNILDNIFRGLTRDVVLQKLLKAI